MPDSNTPWTPDDAFWDEAWADMETRLDRKRRWRMLLPLLLLVAVIGAGTLVLWPEVVPGPPPPPSPMASVLQPAPEMPKATTLPAPSIEDAELEQAIQPSPPADQTGTATSNARRQPTSPPSRAASPGTPAPAPTANEVPNPVESTAPTPSPREVAARVSALPTLSFTLIEPAFNFDPPVVRARTEEIIPVQPFQTLTLEAGATTYPNSYYPGGYVELTRRFPTGRWFVPVGLRYDYGRREVTTSGMDDPQELFGPSYPVPTAGLSTAQAREEFRQPRELQTHTLAVRTGLGRRLSGRLTLEGGLQGGYLMGGSGPTYAVLDSAGVVSVTVAEERFSRSNYGGGGTQFDMSAGGGGNRSVLNPVLNRLSLSTWLRADYRLSGNLHLTLGTTRHLTPVYREGSPAMERQRLELGLRWGR